jgi:hypothetical protein
MEIQIAADFLATTLLVGTGIAFVGVIIVFLNNIIFKYWKYLGWFKHLNFVDEKNYPRSDIK